MATNEYVLKFLLIGKEYEEFNIFQNGELLSKTEYRMIREIVLEREKGNRIISSELARRLKVTRSAISQLVTKMENRGIVKRVDSPVDRKIAYVELSDRALQIYHEQSEIANSFAEKVVEKFGEARMQAFLREYTELAKIFYAVRQESDAGKE